MGDKNVMWDPDNPVAVTRAEVDFNALTLAGYKIQFPTGNGKMKRVKKFDPKAGSFLATTSDVPAEEKRRVKKFKPLDPIEEDEAVEVEEPVEPTD